MKICAWCRHEYDVGGMPMRKLSDAEYRAYSRDPGASHGCCRPCCESAKAEVRQRGRSLLAAPPPQQITLGWL